MRRRADDPKTPRTALDLFLLGERERDESAARVGDQTDRKPWQLDPDRMQKAIAFYRQALAIDPDHFWSRLQLGRCLQSLGRFPEAAEALGACVAIRPKAPWGYSALGLALAEQGRYDEAEHELNQAIGIDADARPPRLHRGVVYWRQKKYDLAVADFEAVLAPPDDKRLVEAAYYRGQLYLERGEVQKALDDFDRVVAATPGFRSVYLDRPLIYLSKGDAPRALADLDTYVSLVRKIDPGGWEVHGLRGRLLRFLYTELPQEKRRGPTGRAMLPLALAELNQAVQMGGNDAGLFDDLGAVLEHAGRLDQAIVAYSRGIALGPRLREAADQARLGLGAIESARRRRRPISPPRPGPPPRTPKPTRGSATSRPSASSPPTPSARPTWPCCTEATITSSCTTWPVSTRPSRKPATLRPPPTRTSPSPSSAGRSSSGRSRPPAPTSST